MTDEESSLYGTSDITYSSHLSTNLSKTLQFRPSVFKQVWIKSHTIEQVPSILNCTILGSNGNNSLSEIPSTFLVESDFSSCYFKCFNKCNDKLACANHPNSGKFDYCLNSWRDNKSSYDFGWDVIWIV